MKVLNHRQLTGLSSRLSRHLRNRCVRIALVGAAVGIGNVFSSLIQSVARNPSLAKQLFGYAILGFALTEETALFALMMAFLIPTSIIGFRWLYNPYSYFIPLFLLKTFPSENQILTFFCALPLVRKMHKEMQILFFYICKSFFIFLLSRLSFSLGYIFMDDLSRAVNQFYPSGTGGGMSSTLPGPSGDPSFLPIHTDDREEGSPSSLGSLTNSNLEYLHDFLNDTTYEEPTTNISPLMSDDIRRQELLDEMDRRVSNGLEKVVDSKLLEAQVALEKKIELTLQKEGYTKDSILHSRPQWRNAAFCTDSKATYISKKGIERTLAKYTQDIRDSPNLKRIFSGVKWGSIKLVKKP